VTRPETPPVPAAVLFDLDDTLYPEHAFVDGGFQAVGRTLARPSGRQAAWLVERLWALHDRDGRGRLFDALIAELGLDDLDGTLAAACVLAYRTHQVHLAPFPGVPELLDGLRRRGVRTGLVSDGYGAVQARKLAGLGEVATRLDAIVLTDDLGPGHGKPSPTAFRVACRLLEVEPSATIYVGNDPRKDFIGARAAGLRTIRVGALPNEGRGAAIAVRPADDADLSVESIDALDAVLTGMTT
jgi:putative hydrolase of the HAD superfamily